jgi:hypothetical protein
MFSLFSKYLNISRLQGAACGASARLRLWLCTPLPRRQMRQGCVALGLGLAGALCLSISICTWRTFALAACSGGAAAPAAGDLVLGEYILRLRAVEWLRACLP